MQHLLVTALKNINYAAQKCMGESGLVSPGFSDFTAFLMTEYKTQHLSIL